LRNELVACLLSICF